MGKQPYRCKSLIIYIGPKAYNFHCIRPLAPCSDLEPKKCILEITVDGPTTYEVMIKTGDGPMDGVKSPILMSIIGDKGVGQTNILTEKGCTSASNEKFEVRSNDVGKLTGFKLSLEKKSKWKPVEVDIVNVGKKS